MSRAYQIGAGGSQLGSVEVDRLITSIREFRETDISHEELGTANGFHEAQRIKVALANYFIELLTLLLDVLEEVDASVREIVVRRINDEGEALRKIEEEVERLAKEGVHTEGFPAARKEQIRILRERGGAVKLELQPYEAAIRVRRLEKQSAHNDLEEMQRDAREKLADIERVVAEATKAIGNLQTKVMDRGVHEAVNTFGALSAAHARHERNWFRAFLVTAVFTLAALSYIVAVPPNVSGTTLEFASAWVRRVLMISVPAVLARVTLAKYNLERNLRIIYAHREAVLTQYRVFESAIGDDMSAKNQFRLEIAKYIFSDPVTGYVSSDVSSEINISPMVGLLEKAAGK